MSSADVVKISEAMAYVGLVGGISPRDLLKIKLRNAAAKKNGIVPQLTKLKNAEPGSLYREGQKGAPHRGTEEQTGEKAPFYEVSGLPAPPEPFDPAKHTCPFECFMNGRGHYFVFGPNGSGDLFITFMIKGKLYGLFIIRKKEKKHAIPGGMKDTDEVAFTDAGLRELTEEAFSKASESDIDKLFSILLKGEPRLVYEGAMDDKRNTNQAYGYSCVMNIHFDGEDAEEIMHEIEALISACEKETIGAEIVEITSNFIENQLWSTHRSSIEAVLSHYVPVQKQTESKCICN